MQALAQRVSSAKICINDKTHSLINEGILAYVCFEKDDNEEVIEKFISKIINFSFFTGDRSIMSENLKEIKGELMIVSQFTLSAITNKGNKPSFHKAASTEKANYLYDLTGKRIPIVGSFSVLNGRKADWYKKLSQFVNSKCNNKFFIVPQFLPVKAWYFGGSCTIDVFCDLEDIEYYSYFSNGLCIDYAHLSMACESREGSLANWIKKLSKLAGHIHLSDSIGEDGEGVLFGKGNISPFIKKILSTEVPKVIEQWEGHLNNFSGFNDALLYIEEYC